MRGQDNPNRCEGSSPGHALRDEVVAALESFVSHHAPRWELPRTFGGHLVGPDAVADLAFTLGWLHQGGVDTIAGRPLVDALRDVMNQIDGPATHTFFSSRVAETIGRFGRFDDDNALVRGLDPTARANLAAACDSTEVLGLLDALPRNYLAVLARCELARERIGLLDDPETLSHLLAATRELLADNPSGYLDDSQVRAGRYDIYTADLYLFCEPMAEELGEVWSRGMCSALDLVHTIASSDGSAFTWGRSTGALSRALTIELAAVALTTGFTAESELGGPAASPDAHAWWHEFGAMAAEGFIADWFGDDGVIAAHARAAVEAYRGPQRRLQMTFDVLGKLAEAAAREIGPRSPRAEAPAPGTFGHRDHLVRFDDRAGVWSFRDDSTEFVVPFVAGPSSDYVAAPRRPGLYGSPVDSTLAAFVPLIHRRGDALTPQRRFAATGAPRSLGHGQSRLDAAWDGFAALHPIDDSPPCEPIDGSRHLTISTDGATLNFSESLRFAETPESLTISVPEYGRPFRVRVDGHPARLVHADVSGVAEWRSAWGPARAVTEIELEPARAIDVAWSVTPIPVVSVFDNDHHYTRAVYGAVDSPGAGSVRTVDWRPGDPLGDVLHVQWPEWLFGLRAEVDDHRALLGDLTAAHTPIVWTQHNLTPHFNDPERYDPIYSLWAEACDVAIHHSHWGLEQVTARYAFKPDCRHVVIAHPHFGDLMGPNARVERDAAAAALNLTATRRERGLPDNPRLRIGVIGAPRPQKSLDLVIAAVEQSRRDDIELVVWSHAFGDEMSNDPRVVGEIYDHVDRSIYDLRLAAVDVIALPFVDHTMLGTGTAADLVAAGVPALASHWPYLAEALGAGAILAGQTVASWTDAIERLDHDALAAARAALRQRRSAVSSATIGAATVGVIADLLGPLKPPQRLPLRTSDTVGRTP